MKQMCTKILLSILVSNSTSACLVDQITPDPKKQKQATAPVQEPPLEVDVNIQKKSISINRRVRRIALDLIGRFPSQEEIESAKFTPSELANTKVSPPFNSRGLARLVDTWLTYPNIASQLARLLASYYNNQLSFKLGNIGTSLPTEIVESDFNQSFEWTLKYFVQQNLNGERSLEKFVESRAVVGKSSLMDALNIVDAIDANPETDERVGLKSEDSPSLGILANPAFLASLHADGAAKQSSLAYHAFKRVLCTSLEGESAHTFSGLTEASEENLATLKTQQPCKSCHQMYDPIAKAMTVSGDIQSFSNWINSAAASLDENTISYSGHDFATPALFYEGLSSDPRIKNCLAKAITEEILQSTNFSKNQTDLYALVYSKIAEENATLSRTLKSLVLSEAYSNERSDSTAVGGLDTNFPGFRLLKKRHWQALSEYLLGSSTSLTFDNHLNLVSNRTSRDQIQFPSANYFGAVLKIAKDLAEAVIEKELVATATVESRKVFALLPEGFGVNEDEEIFKSQLLAIWINFTSDALDPASASYTSFKTIFDNEKSKHSDANQANQRAWFAVLVSIFLSSEFLSL